MGNDEARRFMWPAVQQLGDEGVRRSFGWMRDGLTVLDPAAQLRAFAKRTTRQRGWQLLMENFPLGLCPVSSEPPFPWGWDVKDRATMDRVVRAQESQFAVPVLGLPAVSVPTGMPGPVPMGVQLIGPRFREDLVLDAADVIVAHCPPITPITPIDPRRARPLCGFSYRPSAQGPMGIGILARHDAVTACTVHAPSARRS